MRSPRNKGTARLARKLYSWKDDKGVPHVSETPPAQGGNQPRMQPPMPPRQQRKPKPTTTRRLPSDIVGTRFGNALHYALEHVDFAYPQGPLAMGDALGAATALRILDAILREEAVRQRQPLDQVAGAEPVDGVLDLRRRVGVEVAEAAAEERRAAHLPEQPVEYFGARRAGRGQEFAELLGEVDQDRSALEQARRRVG